MRVAARPQTAADISQKPGAARSPDALISQVETIGVAVPAAQSTYYPPAGQWARRTPAEAGMDAARLNELAETYGVPVMSIHSPTLLLTQRGWGSDPWGKIDRSVDVAPPGSWTPVPVD